MAIKESYRYALDAFGWNVGVCSLTVDQSRLQQFPVLLEILENGEVFSAGGVWYADSTRVQWEGVQHFQHPVLDLLSARIAAHFEAVPRIVVANRSDTRDHRWWDAAVRTAPRGLLPLLHGHVRELYVTREDALWIDVWAASLPDWRPAFPGSDVMPIKIFKSLPAALAS